MRSPGSLSAGAAFAPLRITVRPSLFNVRYWQCDLIECALLGRLVGTPPHQLGAVAEAITGDMIKSNLYHQFRPKRFPFSAAIGTPAARAARCLAGESGQATELLKLSRQRWLLGVGHHRAPPSDLVARSGALGSRSGRYYSANLREWFRARQIGDIKAARKVLEDAARRGDVGAAWKLGRMYADGDEVERSDQRGFEYFRTLADSHAEETPGTAPAVFVAKAFVEIGSYYLAGIAHYIKPDAARAHQMFSYAASYFGDPDAQYRLGRTYLDGQGTAKSPKQAAPLVAERSRQGTI